MSYILTLKSIKCMTHSSTPGNDDLYFRVNVDGAISSSWIPGRPDTTNSWDIDEGNTVNLQPKSSLQNGAEIQGNQLRFIFDNYAHIEIWDYDWVSSDDYLGGADFTPNDPPNGGKTLSSVSEASEYYVDYSMVNIG